MRKRWGEGVEWEKGDKEMEQKKERSMMRNEKRVVRNVKKGKETVSNVKGRRWRLRT